MFQHYALSSSAPTCALLSLGNWPQDEEAGGEAEEEDRRGVCARRRPGGRALSIRRELRGSQGMGVVCNS